MEPTTATLRIFGSLRPHAEELGLPFESEVEMPAEGMTGRQLATQLGLPAEKIEGIFVNHVVRPLSAHVAAGDQLAFVPYDTPGPHRFCLGLYNAGKDDAGE